MNLFYASFGSCRRQGGAKQRCYKQALATVAAYGRGSRRTKAKCKFGRTKAGKCRKTPKRAVAFQVNPRRFSTRYGVGAR